MEEDDSQDELINKNQAHCKRKRSTVWDISDDSDDVEEQSGEEEEESGEGEDGLEEDEEEDTDDDDDDEEEEEEEEEEDGKPQEGPVAGTSADLDGMSSDEDAEKCPICLNSFGSQPVATPESCEHYFCLDCILLWSKNANSCPVDRIVFGSIYLRKCYGGKVQKMITVEKPVKEGQEEVVNLELEQTTCEVCGGSDREDRLLLCDGCDAGYHMECLTPPLDAVPVEEWFCPECEANNRNSRVTDEELSDSDSLPARARPHAARGHRPSAGPGPTRAIARTQQSERVRANVNRHRITQARTAQLAPTYMMQSTWLDDTINAVVAGLNTAVYIRDLSWRPAAGTRRKSGKRRKTRKVSSAKGQSGKASTTGVKRRRRKVRRKSRRKLVVKKQATTRSRIAKNLGIARPKGGSSLPSVYRPSEHTLGNMRADIGAASLSVYGDPYDLDPFVDGVEEEEQRTQVTSLLEAKRRGISHSALRSHQPVARPITTGLSRRGEAIPQSSRCVAEATPVPDLLGSILSGQSMLLMDSSAVVINRDGTLKAARTERPSSLVSPGSSSSSRPSPSFPSLPSPPSSSSHSSPCLPSPSQSQSQSQPTPHSHPAPHSHQPAPGHHRLPPPAPPQPHRPGPSTSSSHRGTNGVHPPYHAHAHAHDRKSASEAMKAPTKAVWEDISALPRIPKIKREGSSSGNTQSRTSSSSSSSNNSSRSNSSSINNSRNGSRDSSGSGAVARGDGRHSDTGGGGGGGGGSSSGGVPGTGIHSLAGDKGRQQGVDQTRGRHQGNSQGGGGAPERAGPSAGFSNSFCPSSSSSSSSRQPPASSSSSSSLSSAAPSSSSLSSSSSSAAVSFRIAASGNSWRSRRLSGAAAAVAAAAAAAAARSRDGVRQDDSGAEDEEAKRRRQQQQQRQQERRDKQKLLVSRTPPKREVKEEEEVEDIYDPFNPTLSDSNSSDGETRIKLEPERVPLASRSAAPTSRSAAPVKSETSEREITETEAEARVRRMEDVRRATPGDGGVRERLTIKREPEETACSRSQEDLKNRATQTLRANIKVKLEPGLAESGETCAHRPFATPSGGTAATASSLDATREPTEAREQTSRPAANSVASGPPKADPVPSRTSSNQKDRKIKAEPVRPPCSQATEKAALQSETTSKGTAAPPPSQGRRSRSSSSEAGGQGRRRDRSSSGQGGTRRGGERGSRRSRSRDRRRPRSSSSRSSQSDSSSSRRRKRRRPRSRSRSGSLSSSREPLSTKKKDQRVSSRERHVDTRGDGGRDPKDKRRPRSRSRSRSRERERRRDRRSPPKPSSSSSSARDRERPGSKDQKKRPRSRSLSRERRKQEEGSSKSALKASGSAASSSKEPRKVKEERKEKPVSSPRDGNHANANKTETKKHVKKESQTSVFALKVESKDPGSDGDAAMAAKADKDPQLLGDKGATKKHVIKKESPASLFEVKRESKDPGFEGHVAMAAATATADGDPQPSKEIKKEKPPESSPGVRPIKREHATVEMCSQTEVKSLLRAEDIKKEPLMLIKEEPCDFWLSDAAETAPETAAASPPPPPPPPPHHPPALHTNTSQTPPSSPTICPGPASSVTVVTSPPPSAPQVPPPPPPPSSSSDDDEDFNVDALLDNLGLLKSSGAKTEQRDAGVAVKQEVVEEEAVKQEREVEVATGEVKVEREELATSEVEAEKEELATSEVKAEREEVATSEVKAEREEAAATSEVKVKVEPEAEEVQSEGQPLLAPAPPPAAVKSKPQVKRVTWNIQEADGPQPEKSASKLALYKLKLKQEGARRPSAQSSNQAPGCSKRGGGASGSAGLPSASGGPAPGDQGDPKEGELPRNDEYLKKLHMQERAIEEVKLAIKPYYQRRDITKDEYKDIVRKAVQKVCHSKSGAIHPVKVANLVKAYVDKYKHMRKHQKPGDGDDGDGGEGNPQNTDDAKDSDSP